MTQCWDCNNLAVQHMWLPHHSSFRRPSAAETARPAITRACHAAGNDTTTPRTVYTKERRSDQVNFVSDQINDAHQRQLHQRGGHHRSGQLLAPRNPLRYLARLQRGIAGRAVARVARHDREGRQQRRQPAHRGRLAGAALACGRGWCLSSVCQM